MITIYHNPRCSKSRETLQLIEAKGFSPNVIKYLESPPSAAELQRICHLMGQPSIKIIRHKESLFGELSLSLSDVRSDAEWCDWLHRYPKLIERPIVIVEDEGGESRAAIGRPPSAVLAILPTS